MKKKKVFYIDNKKFSQAVVDYVTSVNIQKESEGDIPKVTDYIAISFMKIAEGLSHRPNFIRYTYRDEMVMDAVENCLKAIMNYRIDATTRTGNPNAFSYFTQICFYAFLRRLAKEKKQQDIKKAWISRIDIQDLIEYTKGTEGDNETEAYFIDQLKMKIDELYDYESPQKKKKKILKKSKEPEVLELFMEFN